MPWRTSTDRDGPPSSALRQPAVRLFLPVGAEGDVGWAYTRSDVRTPDRVCARDTSTPLRRDPPGPAEQRVTANGPGDGSTAPGVGVQNGGR